MAGFEDGRPPDPDEVRELAGFLRACGRRTIWPASRSTSSSAERARPIPPRAADLVGPLADLGVTWWDERMPWGDELDRAEPMLRRIDQGPPRI